MLSSYALRDSVGLNCHFERTDLPPYTRWNEVIEKFLRLGVRHLRCDIFNHEDAWMTDRYHEILRHLAFGGVKFTFLMGRPGDGQAARYGAPEELIDIIQTEYAGSVAALEGPNEPDNPSVNPGSDPDWVRWTLEQLVAVRQAHILSGIQVPILGPSYIGGGFASEQLGPVGFIADAANVHPYAANRRATQAQIEAQRNGLAPAFSRDADLYATEFGFSVASDAGQWWATIDEREQAALTLCQILTHFKAGVKRSFYYDFTDDGTEDTIDNRFGLLRYDLTERPSYLALQKLLRLCDTYPSPTVPLDYSIEGAPADLQSLAFSNAGGSHLLLLWREQGTEPVTIELSTPEKTGKVSYDLLGEGNDCAGPLPNGPYQMVVADAPVALTLT